MRHAILVVGSQAQGNESLPEVNLRDSEKLRVVTWYACGDQNRRSTLLDDTRGILLRVLRVPVLAYRFYLLVHSTKLWSGRRPLILVRGRTLSARVAAYAGRWGGGDVVKVDFADQPPLGPTRYILLPDGSLDLRTD